MSIAFGATFQEACIHAWALRYFISSGELSGDNLAIAEGQLTYIREKLWHIYPYDCEEIFDQSTGPFSIDLKQGVDGG